MKYIFLCLIFLLPLPAFADSSCNVLPIARVNYRPVTFSTSSVEGYIAYIANCPPCPGGEVCEQCVKPHFIVSENNEPLESEPENVTPDQLVLFPPDLSLMKQFIRGIRYRFRLAPDRDRSWVFTGKNSDSITRGMRTISWIANPPVCTK